MILNDKESWHFPCCLVGQEKQIKMTRTAPLVTAAILTAAMATSSFAARATAPQPTDLTPTFRTAVLNVERLQVFEIGGVVVIRGRAVEKADAEAAGLYAKSLGYNRVANLVQVITPPDDAAIARAVERELTMHRGLEGCKLSVAADRGVVRIAGSVRHEMQKDMALAVVRNVSGVREVHSTLDRE
jgi:osmotically-inducible protein OsmY